MLNRFRNHGLSVCLLALGTVAPGLVAGGELSIEGPPALELLVEDVEGGRMLEPLGGLAQAAPGDLLMLSYAFTVPSGPVEEPYSLTLAIPEILEYQSGTAVGPGSQTEVSFDGGLNFVADRRNQDQGQAPDPSLLTRVTHLRWVFGRPLQPGVRGYLRYRAVKRIAPLEAPPQPEAGPVTENPVQENKP